MATIAENYKGEEEYGPLSRQHSRLELLSHTAALKNVIDNNDSESTPLSARVTPTYSPRALQAAGGTTPLQLSMTQEGSNSSLFGSPNIMDHQESYSSLPANNSFSHSDVGLAEFESSSNNNSTRGNNSGGFLPSPKLGQSRSAFATTTNDNNNHLVTPNTSDHTSTSNAFVPPRNSFKATTERSNKLPYEQLAQHNIWLQQQLRDKDHTIADLQGRMASMERKVDELRQLPTGKISQIPVEDMMEIMQEYGSEVSDTVMPPRKHNIQKASIVRQFRRWNPNFFEYFTFLHGKWVPKLGKQGEMERRMQARKKTKAAMPT